MSLINELLEPTKDYINFADLMAHLSGLNNEPLYAVVTCLLHHDFHQKVSSYAISMDYKITEDKFENEKCIYEFLNVIRVLLSFVDEDWVYHDYSSLDKLSEGTKKKLVSHMGLFVQQFFKKSELKILTYSFAGKILHFSDKNAENSIDSYIEKEHRKYISVAKYVNDLYKNIGSGKPLKFTLKYLFENTSLSRVKLYRLKNLNYSLVSQTDNLKYKNTDDLLRHFYSVLDDEQTGTVTSDRELFKNFYFEYLEVENLINSNLEKSEISPITEQLSTENSKLLKISHLINDLDENQKLLMTYEQLIEELAVANAKIKQLEQVNSKFDTLKQQADKPADDEDTNLRNSAYFLIAVMKNLLLDIEITGFIFQTDNDKGKKEPTQSALTQHIESVGIKDLKTRTIDGLFAKANKMLKNANKR